MDSLTSIRILNLHRLAPWFVPLLQQFPVLGTTLSFRGGDDQPTLFNSDIQGGFEDMTFGISQVFGISKQQVYALG